MDILGRNKLPQVELSEDELNALSGLGKVDTKSGLSFNPYANIGPEFLKLKDDDDDDWLYLSVSTTIQRGAAYSYKVCRQKTLTIRVILTIRVLSNYTRTFGEMCSDWSIWTISRV